MKNLLPSDTRHKITIKQEYTTGHHGNPITTLNAILADRDNIEQVIRGIASRMSSLDRATITDELDHFVDEDGNLYLRFDKQAAYLGNLFLKQTDAIRIKVRFQGRRRRLDEILKTCREMGLVN
jgi:RNA binding exosome subunit